MYENCHRSFDFIWTFSSEDGEQVNSTTLFERRLMLDFLDKFRTAIISAGMTPPETIQADGEIHRFSTNGKKRNTNGWYILFNDGGIPAGYFGDWGRGLKQSWHLDIGRKWTPMEEREYQERMENMRCKRKLEEKIRCKEAQERAAYIWEHAALASDDHPYLVTKGVIGNTLRVQNGELIIPVLYEAKLVSLQFIKPNGEKRFLPGGRIQGGYFVIGDKPEKVICICEGYSTGASLHEATGYPVVVSFSANNLPIVSQHFRDKYPNACIIICADDDIWTEGNPGRTKGREAAAKVNGLLALPDFGQDRPHGKTDFNDLALYQSLDIIKNLIDTAIPVRESGSCESGNEYDNEFRWADPLPLMAPPLSLNPYPLEALPNGIREAVQEAIGFIQCPAPLAACSALSVLSLAGQGLVNVRRAEQLTGPLGLFFLAIAESGERKSTCDKHFTTPIREWEKRQKEVVKEDLIHYQASIQAWNAKNDGIKEAIKNNSKTGKDTSDLEKKLKETQIEKPVSPRVPRLLYTDSTPEALAKALSFGWPSGGFLSSEAGIIFGSHAMGKESTMRNLSLLNTLWDGESSKIDRKSSESFTIQGARLTIGLAVQPGTIYSFMGSTKGLARDIGFMARFLITYPESTQGTRFFKECPSSWGHLSAFHQRIELLLNKGLSITEQGELELPLVEFSKDAKDMWVKFHNDVEQELLPAGEMADVRDVASKAADNVARLAALFYLYEGLSGVVQVEHINRAGRIVAWHLYEAKRFLNGVTLTSQNNALKLENWLLGYCRKENRTCISRRDLKRLGPNTLRKSIEVVNAAVEELIDKKRARWGDDKKNIIEINPKLLEK